MKMILLTICAFPILTWADFAKDTAPYRPTNGTELYGIEIKNSPPSKSGLAKIGVKKGDILVQWNNKNIENEMAAQQAYAEKNVTSAKVLRNGEAKFLGSAK